MSIALSITAIVISIFSIVATLIQNRRINRMILNSSYFSKVFDDYLLSRLPAACKLLSFTKSSKLRDGSELCKCLSEMQTDARYFQYVDGKFYKSLCDKCRNLEDYICGCGNRATDNQKQVLEEVNNRLSAIYTLITNEQFK